MPDEAESLFEEYVQALHEGRHPSRQDFLGRAGAGQQELQRLMQLYDALEGVRDSVVADQAAVVAERTPGAGAPPRAAVLPVPTSIGRYRDLTLIGRGGLGSVYLATDPDLKRRVALKLITAPHLDNARAAAWMLNEGRSLARLQHEGVVRVFEVGTADGRAYIAMEHVDGPSLRDVLARMRALAGVPEPGGAVTPPTPYGPGASDGQAGAAEGLDTVLARELASKAARCELVARIAEALDYCHLNGVIHRDIKPSNVLLTSGARPRLIDFGLAHLQSPEGTLSEITQNLLGTPAYIAPEQVHHGRTGASERSDQFSLGIVLFELLTLTNPFQRATRDQTLEAIALGTLPRVIELDPSVPDDLARICEHCLQRDPALRYARLADLAADLRAYIEQRAISLAPETAPPPPRPRRTRALFIGVGVATAALIATTLGLRAWHRHDMTAMGERVRAVAARLESPLDPVAAKDVFTELARLKSDLRVADARPAAVLGGYEIEPTVDALIRKASDAMAIALRSGRYALSGVPEGPARTDAMRDLLATWRGPLALEEMLCPDCPKNRMDRECGWFDLPPARAGAAYTLARLVPDVAVPFVTRLEPMPPPEADAPLRLPPGGYRLTWLPEPGAARCEQEFDSAWEVPRYRLPLLPPRSELQQQLVSCPGGDVPLGAVGGVAQSEAVPPFRILPHCVTWAELSTIFGPSRCEVLMKAYTAQVPSADVGPALRPDAPALVSGAVAQEYAAQVGARLPLPLELRAARSLPALQLGEGLQSEWTGAPADTAARSRHVLLYSGLDPDASWDHWTEPANCSLPRPATGFRVAISDNP